MDALHSGKVAPKPGDHARAPQPPRGCSRPQPPPRTAMPSALPRPEPLARASSSAHPLARRRGSHLAPPAKRAVSSKNTGCKRASSRATPWGTPRRPSCPRIGKLTKCWQVTEQSWRTHLRSATRCLRPSTRRRPSSHRCPARLLERRRRALSNGSHARRRGRAGVAHQRAHVGAASARAYGQSDAQERKTLKETMRRPVGVPIADRDGRKSTEYRQC